MPAMRKELSGTEFVELLEAGAKKSGSQKRYASELGISESYLCDILNLRREPGEKILEPLGYTRKVTYLPVLKRKS